MRFSYTTLIFYASSFELTSALRIWSLCVYVCPKMDEKTLTHYLMPNKKTKIQLLKVAVRAQNMIIFFWENISTQPQSLNFYHVNPKMLLYKDLHFFLISYDITNKILLCTYTLIVIELRNLVVEHNEICIKPDLKW